MTTSQPTITELNKAHRVIKSKLKLDLDLTQSMSFQKYSDIIRQANEYYYNNGLCEDLAEAIDLIEVR